METAYDATTCAELEVLARDLPEAVAPPAPSRRGPTRFVFSLFGSTEREGRIRIGRRVTCLTAFGNVDLDLREATLDSDVVTIVAVGLFGAIDVYVPEGIEVDLHGLAILGHKGEGGPTRRLARGRRSCASTPSDCSPDRRLARAARLAEAVDRRRDRRHRVRAAQGAGA